MKGRGRLKQLIELFYSLRKLQQKLMVKHNLNEELEVKGEVKSAFKLFEVIESGSNFDSYLQSMRFEAILESPTDAFKIKHIARRYATDS